jgi:sulfur carrier protein
MIKKGKEMIKVSVNGELKELPKGLNVSEMLKELGYTSKGFAVAINTTFVSIKAYDETIIQDGDTIDILAPVQGG